MRCDGCVVLPKKPAPFDKATAASEAMARACIDDNESMTMELAARDIYAANFPIG